MLVKEALERIKNYKPKPCNRKSYNGERKVKIYLDYLGGMKQIDIAKKYGISTTRVIQIIRMCETKVKRLLKVN